ncbi:hypothetical protein GCM10027424_07710 [Psychrobacter pacificensis]
MKNEIYLINATSRYSLKKTEGRVNKHNTKEPTRRGFFNTFSLRIIINELIKIKKKIICIVPFGNILPNTNLFPILTMEIKYTATNIYANEE